MRRMKQWMLMIALLAGFQARPQSAEIEQLLLNWEKLTQFKKILQNMYEGYRVLDQGYRIIRDLSQGNFSLHESFLNELLQVSPAVRQYRRVGEIIRYQLLIVKECKAAGARLIEKGVFVPDELRAISRVYAQQLKRSLQGLDQLALVLTSGVLRMSDAERLDAIDGIHKKLSGQLAFLKAYSQSNELLALQRLHEKGEIDQSKKLGGIR